MLKDTNIHSFIYIFIQHPFHHTFHPLSNKQPTSVLLMHTHTIRPYDQQYHFTSDFYLRTYFLSLPLFHIPSSIPDSRQ